MTRYFEIVWQADFDGVARVINNEMMYDGYPPKLWIEHTLSLSFQKSGLCDDLENFVILNIWELKKRDYESFNSKPDTDYLLEGLSHD